MPLFLRLGQIWINVNHIELVQMLPMSGADKPLYEVRFLYGGNQTFGGDEGDTLLDFLSQHHVVSSME